VRGVSVFDAGSLTRDLTTLACLTFAAIDVEMVMAIRRL
jgi:hypothetical protein